MTLLMNLPLKYIFAWEELRGMPERAAYWNLRLNWPWETKLAVVGLVYEEIETVWV